MTEIFKTGRNSGLYDGIIPQKGNMDIGFFRSEKCILLNGGTRIHLKGPPISVYHPSEYDSATYRALVSAPATYATMKYGIIGIKIVSGNPAQPWITSTIRYVDRTRTTIYLTGAEASDYDEVMVYYYASSPVAGGDMNNLQGDNFAPENFDILTKALNDAMPTIFTRHDLGDGAPEFRHDLDMAKRTTVSPVAGSWTTLIDSDVPTGTFKWVGFPVYINEICIKTDTWYAWPYIDFRITIDGTVMTRGFDATTVDYIRWARFDPSFYPTGSTYAIHPGKLFGNSNEALFFDTYMDDAGKFCWRPFDGHFEVVDSVKIEIRPNSYSFDNAECYVRGWNVPA